MRVVIAVFLAFLISPGFGQGEDWIVERSTSVMDDSEEFLMARPASQEIPAMIGTVRPILLLRCKEKTIDTFIAWQTYLGLERIYVTARLDQEEPDRRQWNISTDKKSTFHPRSAVFARDLYAADRLAARVTPYNENPVTVTFPLDGIQEYLPELFETCGESLTSGGTR